MVKVYLDNNVLVDIEEGKYDLSNFLLLENVEYYYSSAHIGELIEGLNLKLLSVDNRLSLIENLCRTNYIQFGATKPVICRETPKEVFKLENKPEMMYLRCILNNSVSNLIVDRDKFLEILKIRKIDINNISPQNILNELDYALSTMDDNDEKMNINNYLKATDAIGRAVYSTLFNLLDFACYYKDKQTVHSDIARMYDASHAYCAQLCDFFVSQDKRMRYKTEAVYNYLGIGTKIMSTANYIKDFVLFN